MGDESPLRAAPPSLKAAIRRARVEDAERSEVVAELRGAEIARLEMLQTALEPVLAQTPDDVDLFDVGLALGDRPRLFIDMIGFVEMGRDRRQYRFIQNARHGRIVLAETEHLDKITEAVTTYIARRLVEREKALASDSFMRPPPAGEPPSAVKVEETRARAPAPRRSLLRRFLVGAFELAASLVLILFVAAIIWFAWRFAAAFRPGAL